jgi:hypothetical protein
MLESSYIGRALPPQPMLLAATAFWCVGIVVGATVGSGRASAALILVVNGFRLARLIVRFHFSRLSAPAIALMLGLHGCIEISVMLLAGAYGLQGYQRLGCRGPWRRAFCRRRANHEHFPDRQLTATVSAMNTVWKDAIFAARGLRRNTALTCVAAVTLALAGGANTAVFTVVNGVLLRSLPFANADRLMVVSYWPTYSKGRLGAPSLLGSDFLTFRRSNRAFDRVALVVPNGARLTGAGDAATIPGALVTPDFFSVLGITPVIGRTFAPDEGSSTGSGVIVISNKLWRERFGSDSSIAGRAIVLDGEPQTVIGVMAEGCDFPRLPPQAPVRGVSPNPGSEYWRAISVDPA